MTRWSPGRPAGALVVLLVLAGIATTAVVIVSDRLASDSLERDAKADLADQLAHTAPDRLTAAATADLRDPFVAAATETLAAAEVDRLVRATVLKAPAAVLSSRAAVDREGDAPVRRIAVEAVIEGRIEAVQRVLFNLETGTPLILVDDLSVQPTETASKGAQPAAPVLHATMTLSAYWRATP